MPTHASHYVHFQLLKPIEPLRVTVDVVSSGSGSGTVHISLDAGLDDHHLFMTRAQLEALGEAIQREIQRDGAVVAREAHNLEAVGSSPTPATNSAEKAEVA